MGCEQSTDNQVITPTNYEPVSGSAPKLYLPKTALKQQVNDMPNDETHFKLYDHAKHLCAENNLAQAQNVADCFFSNGYIIEAIEIYQRIISKNPNYNCEIEGLGSPQLSVSYYEWNVFQWYNQKKLEKKIKSSHYDAMSLCFVLMVGKKKYANELKKSLMWYQSMLAKNTENIGLTMGYANLFACTGSYDEAIKLYDRVIQLRPDMVNAYASKAVIYEYKRINYEKSKEIALKINQMFQSNPYADFIIARKIKDIDEKISKLKQVSLKHPEYVRVVNQIGIGYGGTKNDYDQAIEWYKKCIEISPSYYSSYNNIGVNNELKKNYEEAKKWYYKAMQIKSDYASPYNNISDVYMQLNWTNDQIQEQAAKHDKVEFGTFCSMLGTAFFNKKPSQAKRAIYWQEKSVKLCPQNFAFWNSLGISVDQNEQYERAIQMYKRCVELNPQFQSAYYNIAIVYKALGQLDKTEQYYKKAVEINPKYSYAWNNLGNIYKNKEEYQQAAQYYQHAIEYNSTYSLALANLGLCQLKLEKYKEAFHVFSRAKQALPNDNNNLSEGNKTFLKQHLDNFEKEGEKWKKTGSITDEEKQSLKKLIEQFENKFKNIAAAVKTLEMPTEKIFQPQILSIIKIIKQDQFELGKIEEIFQLIQTIFHQDEEYFHIIPLLVIEKFTTSVFQKNKNIMNVESELREVMKKIAAKVSVKQFASGENKVLAKIPDIKLTESQILNKNVNLFKETAFFNSAFELYHQVNKVNIEAKKSYTNFSLLVEEARKKSNGIPGGISTKIPIKQSEQFKVMLRIMQKMFKKEIDAQRTIKIITEINEKLKKIQKPSLDVVVKEIMTAWNNQISQILLERNTNQIETQCTISDLLRARCLYNSVDDLVKAVRVVDSYCKTFNYDVIELDNRLSKPQTQDVVFKIKIGEAVCELQLAMKQNEMYTHLDHCVYEILRSPLGVIFGSYLFMSKEVKYPLTTNCKDIAEKLNEPQDNEMKMVKACALYVLEALQTVNRKN